MKKMIILFLLFLSLTIGGCTVKPKPTESPPLVGNDQDEHGCIGSAGYQWCASKQKCLRLWEEPCK